MAVILERSGQGDGPCFIQTAFLPHRGLMLSHLRALLPGHGPVDLVLPEAPPGTDDFAGNASFSFGGAFLIPFANRIRGQQGPDRTIVADVAGRPVVLSANWSGKAPGAEPYAMHGLVLDQTVEVIDTAADHFHARLPAGQFSPPWPGDFELAFAARLADRSLTVAVEAVNQGAERAPIGIGWHPYFLLPSGDRRQARLHVAAKSRLEVGDYDSVLPTGKVLPLAGTPYDFSAVEGVTLADLYLDDCFVDLSPKAGVIAALSDPEAGLNLMIKADKPVSAIQVYAPPDKPFVVIEPQFNWSDPFNPMWGDRDTGMAWVEPGASVTYRVEVEIR